MTKLATNSHVQRFSRGSVCPVCGGCDDDPRGQGLRCSGFISDDGKYVHCSREEHGQGCRFHPNSNTYSHIANGECRCGETHGQRIATSPCSERATIDKVYQYHDLDGSIVSETVRYKNPKKFLQRRPGPGGDFIWSLKGVQTILYRRPELAASDASKPVFVVEGEKDVDRLIESGLIATCNPMGCLKWRPRYSEDLRGRIVVIIADNDENGRKHAQQVARALHGIAASIRIVELPDLPEKGDVSDYLDAGGTIRQLVETARATPNWNGASDPPPTNGDTLAASPAPDKRVQVEITTDRHEVVKHTLAAIAADTELFSRGESLGIVIHETNETAKLPGGVELSHARGSPRFSALPQSVLGCYLTRNCLFYVRRQDKSGEPISVDTHPPDWLIAAIAEHRFWPGVRQLRSITECPYLLENGAVASPGFDGSTGTLYRPSVTIPTLSGSLTQVDAKRAADQLYRVLFQFPFEDGYSWAVWLAALLTAIQRPMISGPAPGFAFNGNKAGTGKGLLIDSIGMLVWGREIGTRSYPSDPIEAEKVKLSLALAAVPCVHFDNLIEGGFYGGPVIDSALTSTFTEGRILGQSRESGTIPLRPVWMLSGNNISPTGDANRRWLPCNLVTQVEYPHERRDIEQPNLRAFILTQRAEMLRAALVILKSHAIAGRPAGPSKDDPATPWAPLGSFEEWDRVVRAAVWWATGCDCLTTQRKGTEEMPDRSDKLALLEGWKEIDSDGKGRTIEDALRLAGDDPVKYATLRSALMALSRDGKMPSTTKVGYKLRGMKRTPFKGMRFDVLGESASHQNLWSVIKC